LRGDAWAVNRLLVEERSSDKAASRAELFKTLQRTLVKMGNKHTRLLTASESETLDEQVQAMSLPNPAALQPLSRFGAEDLRDLADKAVIYFYVRSLARAPTWMPRPMTKYVVSAAEAVSYHNACKMAPCSVVVTVFATDCIAAPIADFLFLFDVPPPEDLAALPPKSYLCWFDSPCRRALARKTLKIPIAAYVVDDGTLDNRHEICL